MLTYRLFRFREVCFLGRFAVPHVPTLNRVAIELAPCIILTPLDCYWEGSILLDPYEEFRPVAPANDTACLQDSPTGINSTEMTWGNLDFSVLRRCLLNSSESGYTPWLDEVCY